MKPKIAPPIYIHLADDYSAADLQREVGRSHWFGYPDLTPDMEIPTITEEDGTEYGLTLICQINLADLPQTEGNPLPSAGLLLFFADIAYYGGDWDEPAISLHLSDNKVCRVLYVPADKMDQLEYRGDDIYEQDEATAIPLIFNDVRPTLEEPTLQLLGTTNALEWETWPKPCEDWQLLLVMDSMEGADYDYNFVDYGQLCFLIDPRSLAERDFSNVLSIILSS